MKCEGRGIYAKYGTCFEGVRKQRGVFCQYRKLEGINWHFRNLLLHEKPYVWQPLVTTFLHSNPNPRVIIQPPPSEMRPPPPLANTTYSHHHRLNQLHPIFSLVVLVSIESPSGARERITHRGRGSPRGLFPTTTTISTPFLLLTIIPGAVLWTERCGDQNTGTCEFRVVLVYKENRAGDRRIFPARSWCIFRRPVRDFSGR